MPEEHNTFQETAADLGEKLENPQVCIEQCMSLPEFIATLMQLRQKIENVLQTLETNIVKSAQDKPQIITENGERHILANLYGLMGVITSSKGAPLSIHVEESISWVQEFEKIIDELNVQLVGDRELLTSDGQIITLKSPIDQSTIDILSKTLLHASEGKLRIMQTNAK